MPSSSSSSSTHKPDSEQQPKRLKSEAEAEAGFKLIPSLPDDVALNCLARVPRSEHGTLSQVSKSLRSLLSSPHFFSTRSLLHCTETLFYVTLSGGEGEYEWLALYPNPFASNLLVPVPIPPYPFLGILSQAACAVVGPIMYVIAATVGEFRSPDVWALDCRFNRWQRAPSMLVPRLRPVVGVVDGKVYVMGGCKRSAGVWAEVLDPAIGSWEEVPPPTLVSEEKRDLWVSRVLDGKIYTTVPYYRGFAYDPRKRVWETADSFIWLGHEGTSCVVDGVLYFCDASNKIKCLELRPVVGSNLKELMGLDEFSLIFSGWEANLTAVCGKLFVLWIYPGTKDRREICCAEIEVNKNGEGELTGKVCWCQHILTRPRESYIVQCSALVL